MVDTQLKQLSTTEYTLYAHCQSSHITYFYTMEGAMVYSAGREEGQTDSNPNKPPHRDITVYPISRTNLSRF